MKLNETKLTYCDYELLEKMRSDLSLDYSIATHNIYLDITAQSQLPDSFENKEDATHEDIAKNIMEKGLNISENCWSVFLTIYGYGYLKRILGNDLRRKEFFIRYNYWKETKVNNIIIAVPPKIRLDGKEYFVGVLEDSFYSLKHNFPDGNNILNTMLLSHKIPSEFIYGSYSRNRFPNEKEQVLTLKDFENKQLFQLKTNPNHISKLDENKQEIFYEKLLKETGVSKDILNAVQEKELDENPIIHTTIEQKKAYEHEFQRRGK